MAQGNKNQKTGAAKSRKGNEGKQGRKQEEYYQEEIPAFLQAEVMIILSFAAAVLLFLSNFRLCGVVGNFLRGVQLGLFGVVGYIVPFILFIGTSFYIANRGNWKAVVKLSAVIGAALIICGIAQLISGIELAEGESFLTFYKVSGVNGKGGGLIGGMLSFGLRSIVGTIGTYLIFVVVLIICGVCITEKSVVNAVKNGGDRAYQYAREDAVRRREEREERLEEKRRLREDNVVRGVDFGSIWIQKDKPSAESGQLGIKQEFPEDLSPGKGGQFPEGEQPGKAISFQEGPGSLGGAPYPGRQFQDKAGVDSLTDKLAPSPADVFSGRIQLPPEYAEPVPFEEDRPEVEAGGSLPKSLGKETLGKRASDKKVAVAVKEDKPEDKILTFSKKESKRREGPLYADREMLTLEEMSADFGLTDSGGSRKKDEADIWPGKREEYGEAPFIEEISMGDTSMGDTSMGDTSIGDISMGDVSDGGIPYQEPLDGVSPKDPALEKGVDEPFFREPMDGAALKKEISQEADLDDGYFLDEDFGQEMGDFEEEDELFAPAKIPAKREDPPARDDAGDHVFVPEGSKRVVTANGKIIETETELLHKRIEKKREEALEGTGQEAARAAKDPKELKVKKPYVFPPTTLLKKGTHSGESFSEQEYKDTAIKLQQTLRNFGVGVTVTNISCGPSVTRYELHPEQGVKVSKIVSLADDIKLSLAAAEIRIEAPIPGKSAVGIEVPNKENSIVYLRELLESDGFVNSKSRLTFAVGKDIAGQPVTADIGKMPHLLIAGATGSGKSVCINTLIMSIIYKADPEDVKLIMVDPKVVELSVYNGIPHLMIPVVTDPKKASGALNWAVAEMGDRYKKFAEYNVRDLKGYNEKIKSIQGIPEEKRPHKLPQIVIIIDELADLMMVVPGEVEDAICRLAQLARAAGIHLVIATQRPSVNVITGLIKANVPSRIAFSVSSGVDSRTIIDMNGAEKLLGKGDMLFYPSGVPKPQRVQGAFVSDQEVSQVVEFLTQQGLTASYSKDMENRMLSAGTETPGGGDGSRDEYFAQAGRFIIEKDKASIGMLQRMFKIGFNRAARIMDQLADVGVVGEEEGTKPRKILMTMEEFDQFLGGGE